MVVLPGKGHEHTFWRAGNVLYLFYRNILDRVRRVAQAGKIGSVEEKLKDDGCTWVCWGFWGAHSVQFVLILKLISLRTSVFD